MVVGKSNKDAFVEFLCIHHSTETRNDRQLEQDVERDPEGKITSCGDTQVNQKLDFKWRCNSKSRNVARLRLRPASISHTFPTRKVRQTLAYRPLQPPSGSGLLSAYTQDPIWPLEYHHL